MEKLVFVSGYENRKINVFGQLFIIFEIKSKSFRFQHALKNQKKNYKVIYFRIFLK